VNSVINRSAIVCPLSVLSNWSSQIEEHVHPKAGVRVHIYHEGGRDVSASYLAKCDIVITTYQVISAEIPSIKKCAQTTDDEDFSDEPQAKRRKKNGQGLYSVKFKVFWDIQ
jgi:SWI/SNF-related matrix-associated actin-dependent regulator of chromatin subfamily A3